MGKGTIVSPGDAIIAAKQNLKVEELVSHINLQPEGAQTGLAASTIGIRYEGRARVLLDSQMLGSDDKVYIEIAKASSAGDEETTIEIYDDTAAAVAASLAVTGASPRSRSGDIAASLTAGNEVHVRWNVTTASGTAGATFDAISAKLVVICG